jgi:hypothetical protein
MSLHSWDIVVLRAAYLLILLAFAFAGALVPLPLNAFPYEYSAAAPFFLGSGINPLKLNEGLATCVRHSGQIALDGPGVSGASVILKAVKSRKELFSVLGASVAVSAQTFIGGGSLSADHLEQNDFFEDSLTWVLLARTEFGRVGLNNPELLAKFQKMIDENRHAEFAAACGTHYIAQQTMGASVFAIYTLRNLSQSQKSRIEVLLKAGASLGPIFSGNLEAEFKNVLAQATRSSQLSCHVYAVGGSGISDLSGLVEGYWTDIGRVQQTIGRYVATLTPKRAAPIRYEAISMREFGYREASPVDFQRRDDVLAKYYFIIREGEDLSTRLYGLIFKGRSVSSKLGIEQLQEYRRLYDAIVKDLERLHESAVRCYDDPRACAYPTATWPSFQWPDGDADARAATGADQCIVDQTMPSRIANRERPVGRGWYQDLSKEECAYYRALGVSRKCINRREAVELQMIGAAPLCLDSKFVAWNFC